MNPGSAHASPLGLLLVERGLMSQEQLEDALLEQRVSGKRLGAILLDNRIVTQNDLTASLQAQVHAVVGDEHADRAREAETAQGDSGDAPRRRLFRRKRRDEDVHDSPNAKLEELLHLTETQNDALRAELAQQRAAVGLAHAELRLRASRIAELETSLASLLEERRRLAVGLRAEIGELESDLRSLLATTAQDGPTQPVLAQPQR